MRKKPKLINEKVRVIKDKKYFNSPLDEKNKPYWIPVVVKDKSYLLGFINAYHFFTDLHALPSHDMEIALSSDRFNDILTDGTRMHNLTRVQLKTKLKELYFASKGEDHPENKGNILEHYYMSFSCAKCGMFYAFKNEDEIPEDDFKCVTCDNTLISYIHENDEYFNFDGDAGDVDKIVEEINKEKGD